MANEDLTGKKVTLDLSIRPELPADYQTFKEVATQLQVVDEDSYAIAAAMIQKEVRWGSVVDSFFDKGREQALQLHRWFTSTISGLKSGYAARAILEPRMKAYKRKVEDERIAKEREQSRLAEEARVKAAIEAQRIQDAADAEAARLRKAGEMRQAREIVATAAEQATAVVEQADSLADLGTIEQAPAKLAGVSDSRPWVGELVDMKALCLAIGTGKVPLEWLTPVRGQGEQMVPLVSVNQGVIDYIAKRMGKEDLQIPGIKGTRSVQLRFSKSAGAAPQESNEW